MNKKQNLSGKRFGKLMVEDESFWDRSKKKTFWKCKCDCGNITYVVASSLKTGNTMSCGKCGSDIGSRMKKHGMYKSRIYNIWENMIARCSNINCKAYRHYGGRGITVCEYWKDEHGFENFYKWALEHGYSDKLTIDRINVNGNYEPSNCRWITQQEQVNNRRNSIRVYANGNYISIREMSKITGLTYKQIKWKVDKGEIEAKRLEEIQNA